MLKKRVFRLKISAFVLEIYKVIQWKIYESEDLNLTDVEKQIYYIKLTGILISLKK